MRYRSAVAIALASLLGFTSAAPAIPLFRGGPMIFDVGNDRPGMLPTGEVSFGWVTDLNGDGRDDIVCQNHADFGSTGSVSVLINNSAPALPSVLHPKRNFPIDPNLGRLAIADFDHDGKPDLMATVDSTLRFYAGDGLGGFSPNHIDFNQHKPRPEVFPAELNGDGNLDVLTALQSEVALFFGNGAGSFTEGPSVTFSYYNLQALQDVTGDGKPDLVGWRTYPTEYVRVDVGRGDGTFESPVYSTTSLTAAGSPMRVGDFDEDSVPDLAIMAMCCAPPKVAILHGAGGGSFVESHTFTLPRSAQASFAARDMDLDGHLDLVVTFNQWASLHPPGQGMNNLLVLFGDGTGHFPTQSWLNGGGNPMPVLLGDFDVDGLPDIATASLFDVIPGYPSAHAVNVLLNEGGRKFGSGPDRAASRSPLSEQVADMNRDGIPDLLISDNDASIEVHLGDGNGGFGSTLIQPLAPSSSVNRFAVGDIDRNGTLDIAAGGVDLLHGNGDGTFTSGAPIGPGTREESLTDLNRDGILDLILLGSASLDVQLGTGGRFQPTVSYPLPTNGRDFHVEDWNRDGKPDVAVATFSGILLYTGSATGALTLASTIESGWAFTDVTSGDFNRDGRPDLAGRDEYYSSAPDDAQGSSIYLANAAGGFGPRTLLPAFDRYGSEIASWDVNRDGSPDLVVGSEGSWIDTAYPSQASFASAGVWLGNGAGAFRHDGDYLVGLTRIQNRISFGDIDRNGQTDVIGGNEDWITDTTGVSYVSFLRGALPPFSGQFGGHAEYATSTGPSALAAADFNRDGRLDVAAIGGNAVNILLGNGGGGLAQSSSIEVGNGVVAAGAADLDRDGDQDLVAIANDGSCSLVINDGQGQFSTIPIHVGSDVTDMALGDLNHDGVPDLVVCDTASGTIVVKMGTGAPGFSDPVEYFPANGGVHAALGDVNRDGWLDVMVDDPWLGNVAIFLNDGTGGLLESAYVATGDGTRDIALVDMDRDGRLDIVATRVSAGVNRITVLLANGMGGFDSPTHYVVYNDLRDVTAGDVDANGITDLLIATNDGLIVERGNGAGGLLTTYEPYSTSIQAWSVAQADLDRDGRPDLITANGALNVSVFLGSDATPTGIAATAAPPARATLQQNRPNPFNPRTEIHFTLPNPGPACLRVFDAAGRVVATLADGPLGAGEHRVSWDGRTRAGAPAASGVYFYRLEAAGFSHSKRMVLLR